MSDYFVPAGIAIRHPDCLFIDGAWVTPASKRRLHVTNPASEEVVASVVEAGEQDADDAVAAARRAFDEGVWPTLTPRERAPYLRRMADHLRTRGTELGLAWSLQTGVPQRMAANVATGPTSLLDYFANLAETFEFAKAQQRKDGFGIIVHEPVGVVAAVVPWNAPFSLAIHKVAPALAAGCTLVLKPAPESPLDAYLIAEAAEVAGLPPGVLNLLPADREVSDRLIRNPAIDKVSFTGSTVAGKHIAEVCASRVARVGLELGGKSAAIVLDDIPVEQVVPTLMPASTLVSGQACAALTRVVVSRKRRDELVEALAVAYNSIVVGDPLDLNTQMGPLAMKRQQERVLSYIDKGRAQGARLVCGGSRPPHLPKGYFVQPTIFSGVENHFTIAQEEIFGPVLSVIACDSDDEAIRIANDSVYGLNGSVYTNDANRAYAIARRVRAGNFSQNGWIVDNKFPFGGFKQSGIGRQGGIEGLHEYLEVKTIFMPQLPTTL